MPDGAIVVPDTHAAPKDYTLTGAQEVALKSVRAVIDGSGAATSFLPTLQLLDQNGHVCWEGSTSTTVAAGGSADVSWFPGLGGSGGGSTVAGSLMCARANAVGNQTVVEGDPGTIVTWGEAPIDTGSPTPFWSGGAPDRLTAPVNGIYLFLTTLNWGAFPNDVFFGCYLYRNTDDIPTEKFTYEWASTGIPASGRNADTYMAGHHGIFSATAGDFFRIVAYNNNVGLTAVDLIDNRPGFQHYSSFMMILLAAT